MEGCKEGRRGEGEEGSRGRDGWSWRKTGGGCLEVGREGRSEGGREGGREGGGGKERGKEGMFIGVDGEME